MQALRSVLIEVKKADDVPYAVSYCEKFGTVKHAFSYSGKKDNYFLLLEFVNETGPEMLLKTCECKKIPDSVPVCSRILQYERIFCADLPKVKITEESIPKSSLEPGISISEIIQDIYSTEKLTELDIRLRYFCCVLIQESVSGLFPYCEIIPFGSSVNGIGRRGCDLDVKLRLYSKQGNGNAELSFVNKSYAGKPKIYLQRVINCLAEVFRAFTPGFYYVDKVLNARVPIVKMSNELLQLECDISINNMASVYMSRIMHFCGEIDDRVRPLMFAIKKWAKEAKISISLPGSTISNYAITNMVIFFLQNRPHPILPALNDALVIVGDENSDDLDVKYLKPIAIFKSSASLNKESLAVLLKEFLLFLAFEPFQEYAISFMDGKKRPRPCEDTVPLWMQYPFDESMNIAKNVSYSEFEIMRQKAKLSAEYLQNNLKQKDDHYNNDFCALLGISSVCNIGEMPKENVLLMHKA